LSAVNPPIGFRELNAFMRGRGSWGEAWSNMMEALMVVPTLIKEHMEVLGSDGAHVGTVDHMEGADEIKLTKDDRDAAGEDHYIPLAWVVHAEIKVHLKQCGDDAKARWHTH
jgi:hypothetical protein